MPRNSNRCHCLTDRRCPSTCHCLAGKALSDRPTVSVSISLADSFLLSDKARGGAVITMDEEQLPEGPHVGSAPWGTVFWRSTSMKTLLPVWYRNKSRACHVIHITRQSKPSFVTVNWTDRTIVKGEIAAEPCASEEYTSSSSTRNQEV
jgi:hypothetical protein